MYRRLSVELIICSVTPTAKTRDHMALERCEAQCRLPHP